MCTNDEQPHLLLLLGLSWAGASTVQEAHITARKLTAPGRYLYLSVQVPVLGICKRWEERRFLITLYLPCISSSSNVGFKRALHAARAL